MAIPLNDSIGRGFIVKLFFLLFVFMLPAAQVIASPNLRVQLDQGIFEGVDKGDYVVFKGIPYAKPPVGNLRWRAPQAPTKHKGVFLANTYGSECVQVAFNFLGESEPGKEKVIGTEDCLYLNIWIPKGVETKNLPVMFWIHGGAYILGSANQKMGFIDLYEGSKLVQEGKVIMVSHNYRLGPLGFFAHKDLVGESKSGTTGNYGILDHIAALRWVKKNIGSFGGDPKNVTLFGESAGGSSVFALLASPLAKGLFSAAIAQSGALFNKSFKEDLAVGNHLVEKLGFESEIKPMNKLRKVPAEEIVRSLQVDMAVPEDRPAVSFGYTADGVVIKDDVLTTILKGNHNKVPVIIGSNADEMTVLAPLFLRGQTNMTDSEYKVAVSGLYKLKNIDEVMTVYNKEKFGSNFEAFKQLMADTMFHTPVQVIAKALDKHNPGSVYTYTYSKKVLGLGAGHALDLMYLFGKEKLLMALTYPFSRGIFSPFYFKSTIRSEKNFSRMFMRYWTRFATNQNPNSIEGEDINVQDPHWPKFQTGQVLDLNEEASSVDIQDSTQINFLEKIMKKNIKKQCRQLLK